VIATSKTGATIADKTPGENLKKLAQSIKERRAEKRERGELIRKRKG
jgi:hypothetical protein